MKLPRRWIDADRLTQGAAVATDSKFCLAGLQPLPRLVEARQRRATSSRDSCAEIEAPVDIEGKVAHGIGMVFETLAELGSARGRAPRLELECVGTPAP